MSMVQTIHWCWIGLHWTRISTRDVCRRTARSWQVSWTATRCWRFAAIRPRTVGASWIRSSTHGVTERYRWTITPLVLTGRRAGAEQYLGPRLLGTFIIGGFVPSNA